MLKSTFKTLKRSKSDLVEIKYVARTIRLRLLNNTMNSNEASFDHDKHIQKSFWRYVKEHNKQGTSISPSFDSSTCTQFFSKFFRSNNPSKSFIIPNWIPPLAESSVPYNASPPSYQQVTETINRMKSSGSPCPLDKISVIPFKRCPYLRSYIIAVFKVIWQSWKIPADWKKACTVLVHRKDDTEGPSNFRHITLESVPFKIFISCLRDSVFAFLKAIDFIGNEIQKGFLPKISGTFELTAQMANAINTARIKQRSLVITVLDLKNAFGEVHHSLIPEVLKHHHVPTHTAIDS